MILLLAIDDDRGEVEVLAEDEVDQGATAEVVREIETIETVRRIIAIITKVVDEVEAAEVVVEVEVVHTIEKETTIIINIVDLQERTTK